MGLPWIRDIDLNISSNEYTTKLSVNRCLDGLVANDIYLDGLIEAGLSRSTGLRFASRQQILDFDPVSGAISPKNLMAVSATYSEVLTGVTTDDGFITPNTLTQIFKNNAVIPKLVFIDVTHIPKMVSVGQIVNSAKTEINNAVPLEGTTIYVRCIWHSVADTEAAEDSEQALANKSGQIVVAPFFIGSLTDDKERIFTFETTETAGSWKFIRQRTTYELTAREKADGYKSLF